MLAFWLGNFMVFVYNLMLCNLLLLHRAKGRYSISFFAHPCYDITTRSC